VDYRCPGEPVTVFISKGGKPESTIGRKCLCNALLANIGLAQVRAGKHVEVGLVTSGDDLKAIPQFLPEGQHSYSAADVVAKLLGAMEQPESRSAGRMATASSPTESCGLPA